MHHTRIEIRTERGRGTYDVTPHVRDAVRTSGVRDGLATLFVHHTSASIIVNENADPDVQRDLDAFFARLVPDGDPLFVHVAEGPDDMAGHIRAALTLTSVNIPVVDGRLDLGTWQGVYLWEHRKAPHTRRLTITILG